MSEWHADEAMAECLDLRVKVTELEATIAKYEAAIDTVLEASLAWAAYPEGLSDTIDALAELRSTNDKK